jgi:8-hydroxy-5-deazaflavin:NADPH oxidoreductase
MKIGFLGAGAVAVTFARHLIYAGHDVLLSNSRGAETLSPVIEMLGPGARAATRQEAAEADIVVLATRWPQVAEAVSGIDWKGKILIDTTNLLETFAPEFRRADIGGRISSEVVAELARGASVVKALNSVPMDWISEVPGDGQTVLWVSGNDASANAEVVDLLKALRFAPVDLGPLDPGARLTQIDNPLIGLHLKLVGKLDE